METIGKLLEDNKVELEYYIQGYIYKDFNAFENKTNDICYIPEYGVDDDNTIEDSYTYQDFLDIAKGVFDSNGFEGKPEVLAGKLFEFCDWQSPETLVEEWGDMGEYEDYPEAHGIIKIND